MRYGAIAASSRPTTTIGRFYGDPGAGNFYLGVSPNISTIATHETKMSAPLAMIRTFSSSNAPPWASVDSIIAGGRIPWLSWKEGSFTNSDIAAGVHDDWIHGIADQFKARAPWPLWWTFHHEPENDSITIGAANAAAYRAAQRRIKTTFRADGVTNDVFVAVLFMCPFTFTPASGRDWRTWYPDWRNITGLGTAASPDPNDFWKHGEPNSVVDIFGIDFYHSWHIESAPVDPMSKWNDSTGPGVWSTHLQPKTAFLGQPYAIGEYSTAAAQDGIVFDPNADGSFTAAEYNAQVAAGTITFYPAQTDAWIDSYFGNKDNGFVAFCWWDSSLIPAGQIGDSPLSVADPAETRWKRLGVWGNKPQAKLWTG